MNNPRNLEFYSQILVFRNDLSREYLLFKSLSNLEQRDLQFLAHSLSLEFEYSVATKTARVSRQVSLEMEGSTRLENTGLDDEQTANHTIPGINLESDFEFLDFTHDAGNADLEGEFDANHLTRYGGLAEHSAAVTEPPSDVGIDLERTSRALDNNSHDPLMQELSDISTFLICTTCHPYKDRCDGKELECHSCQFSGLTCILPIPPMNEYVFGTRSTS